MTEKEIEQERRKILQNPDGYFTCHEEVDNTYQNKVIDRLTADGIHARLDGMSYGKYKGKEYLGQGRSTRMSIGTVDVRNYRPHRVTGTRGRYKPLTESERTKIKRMYLVEGANTADIARVFDVSQTTIASHLHEMGVVMNRDPKKRSSVDGSEISSKRLPVTSDASEAKADRLIWTQEMDKQLWDMYFNDVPNEQIAERMYCTKSAVISRISKTGMAKKKRRLRKKGK